MIIIMLKKLTYHIRIFLGVEKILKQQRHLILQQQKRLTQLRRELVTQKHQTDRATSCLEFATIDDTRMRESNKFQNIHEIIPLLTPMDITGAKYRRVGRDYDGGYVMLDDFSSRKIDAAYSFGIGKDVSWDEEIAELGIDIYMYDHTIDKIPKYHSRFHFYKEGVTGDPEEVGLETLGNLVSRNGHETSENLLLKMDIEGYEWSVFKETPSLVIGQFVQIVIELHGLNPNKSKEEISQIVSVLKKINQTHQSIHVHANGVTSISWLGELTLPELLEVTYIRRAEYTDRLVRNTRTFPTEIDQPTFPWLPDVYLGTFTTQTKGK
jgi:hypothetical protein